MTASTQLAPVMTAVAQARGLPNEHYISPAIFEEEKHAVLFANWLAIGFGKDIPEAGDVRPITALGLPLLIVRDRDGEIGVFQNTCRHRGMILVEEPGKIEGALRCPYHSWCYSLKGELRATPHVGGPGQNTHTEIKRDALGLTKIRFHIWRDIIFVNISGDAPDFEVAHKDVIARWAEFDQPLFHGGAESSFKLAVKTNWKLAVENYCESYHLPWVHPGLNSYSRLEDHYNIEAPQLYSGQGSWVYRQLKSDMGAAFPDFADLSPQWCCWVCIVTMPMRSFWNPLIRNRPSNMWKSITHLKRPVVQTSPNCVPRTQSFGKVCSRRISSLSKGCSAGVMGCFLTVANFHLPWMAPPITSTIGWQRKWTTGASER
jgi:phenylpropionate dioxygenase-like ring-hydroxylating dioxygenase large terminal subunit